MIDSSLDCIIDKDDRFVLWLANVRRSVVDPWENSNDISQEELIRRINDYLQCRGYQNGPWRLCAFMDSKPSLTE